MAIAVTKILTFKKESKAIKRAYIEKGKNALTVELNDGAKYDYLAVSPETVQAWENAESAGKFYNSVIKSHEFVKRATD